MANEKTKVKTGKGLEWKLMMTDEKGFLLGIHFDRHRKIGKAQMDILKAALWDAAEKLDDLEDSKRNRACAKHALTVKVGAGGAALTHNALGVGLDAAGGQSRTTDGLCHTGSK